MTGLRALLPTASTFGGFRRSLQETTQGSPLRRPRWLVGTAAAALFSGLFLLGDLRGGTFEVTMLFVVPIAVCAIEFGLWGAIAAGLLSLALVFAWDLTRPDADLPAIGYLTRAVTFLLLGGLLGRFVTTRRALEQTIARSEELSLDLIATAGFDGYFKRLNHAWEDTLGWSLEEL